MAVGGHQVVEGREGHSVLIITEQEHQGLKPVGTLRGSDTAPTCILCSLTVLEPNCGGVREGRPRVTCQALGRTHLLPHTPTCSTTQSLCTCWPRALQAQSSQKRQFQGWSNREVGQVLAGHAGEGKGIKPPNAPGFCYPHPAEMWPCGWAQSWREQPGDLTPLSF